MCAEASGLIAWCMWELQLVLRLTLGEMKLEQDPSCLWGVLWTVGFNKEVMGKVGSGEIRISF